MARCKTCSRTMFGGAREGDLRFCNARCKGAYGAVVRAQEVPDEEVEATARAVYAGACPCCGGAGPVDVHTGYRVWSVVYHCAHGAHLRISCTACGKRQIRRDLGFCSLLGWWSVPGLVMTPIQLVRNVRALRRAAPDEGPSPALHRAVREHLGERRWQDERRAA